MEDNIIEIIREKLKTGEMKTENLKQICKAMMTEEDFAKLDEMIKKMEEEEKDD